MLAIREARAEPIPGYRLIERLGRGGFGEVWKAEAPGGFLKAIKFVFGSVSGVGSTPSFTSPGGAESGASQELSALSQLLNVRHPFILSLERFDVVDGQLLIVMELADRGLDDRLRECRANNLPGIPRDELLKYMAEAAEALDMMSEEHGLQHLDIKPQNLFLVRKHIKVADFGLVKKLEATEQDHKGGVTPMYAPPEVFNGRVSRQSDQYSLAIVYQEMLTGARPFQGETSMALMMEHVLKPPNLLPLPLGDRDAIGRALSKQPADRFPNCTALVEALAAARAERVVLPGATPASSTTPANVGQPAPTTPKGPILLTPTDGAAPPKPESVGVSRLTLKRMPPPPPASLTSRLSTKALSPPPAGKAPEPPVSVPAVEPPSATTNPVPSTGSPEEAVAPSLSDSTQRSRLTATSRVFLESIPTKLAAEIHPEGTLVPTLVVAAGGTGIRLAEQFRRRVAVRFGEGAAKLPLRFLHLDALPTAIEDLAREIDLPKEAFDAFLPCKLRKVADYRNAWPTLRHLNAWLPADHLLRIGAAGDTRGDRALGRLALLDNIARVTGRLVHELEKLMSPDTARVAEESTGLRFRVDQPRVIVAAGLGGGTGSGMALDLAYQVQAVLLGAGYADPDVRLHLVAHVHPQGQDEQQRANHYAVAQDLLNLTQDGASFKLAVPVLPTMPSVFRPPARTVNFIDAHCPELPDPKLAVALDSLAEFLLQTSCGPMGAELDGVGDQLPSFRSVGWWAVTCPRDKALRSAACDLARGLVSQWLEPIPPEEAESLALLTRNGINAETLAPPKILEQLNARVAELDAPFHERAAEIVNELIEDVESGGASDILAAAGTTRERLRRLLGHDYMSDDAVKTGDARIVAEYRQAARLAAEDYAKPLRFQVAQTLERRGARLARARKVWEALLDYYGALHERYTELDSFKQAERDAGAAAALLARQLGVSNSPLRPLVRALENFAKDKIAWAVRQAIAETYLDIRGALQSMTNGMAHAFRKLEMIASRLYADIQRAEQLDLGFAQQAMFPGGQVTLQEAVATIRSQVPAASIAELESLVRQKCLDHRDGMWSALQGEEPDADELALDFGSTVATWLRQFQPGFEVCAALLERHGRDVALAMDEISVLHDWAAPTLQPREQGIAYTVIGCPATADGLALRGGIDRHLWKHPVKVVMHGDETLMIARLAAHEQPAKLLPMWLLKSRPLYDAACRSAYRPDVLRGLFTEDGG